MFLRKLTAGGTSRSFGVEVAKLAGLPGAVIARARAILTTLEAGRGDPQGPTRVSPERDASPQLGLFETRASSLAPSEPCGADAGEAGAVASANAVAAEILAILRRTDPDELSPRAALDLVAELRRKLTESGSRGPS